MVELLANLANVVARRRFRRFGGRAVASPLEHSPHPTQVEPETGAGSFRPLTAANRFGRNGLWRLVPNLGAKLSNLLYLRANRYLDRVSIYTARNCHRHFRSLCDRDLG